MNLMKKGYCRTLMGIFYIMKPFLPYHPPKELYTMDEIPTLLKAEGKNSVLLITDKVLRSQGITKTLENRLNQDNIKCKIYDRTNPNPTIHNAEEALQEYLEHSCEAIIAFGGGSAMDCAKAVGARVARPNKSLANMGGTLKVLRRIPLLIAIPTTSGTGSEATPAAVITDSEHHHKYTVNDFVLTPSYAVLDPTVTFTLPAHLTATTGMDALTHAIEAYIGRSTTKTSRSQAAKASSLIFANIEKVYLNGEDYEARENMLLASYLAGKAFSMSYVGYVHAVAHTLGGAYNIPHGLANAVLLPHVLEGYGKSAHKKLYRLAVMAGIADQSDSYELASSKLIAKIRELNRKMKIPSSLSGIIEADIPKLAKLADHEANPLYPVPKLMDAKELEQFYYKVADWSYV